MNRIQITTEIRALTFNIGDYLNRAKGLCESRGRVDHAREFMEAARQSTDVLGGILRGAQLLLSPEEFDQMIAAAGIPVEIVPELLTNTTEFIAQLPKVP